MPRDPFYSPSRRPEGEDRDLGPAAEPEPWVVPEAAVGVQEHLAHPVEPARVPARQQRQDGPTRQGEAYLPAVGVAGELEVEAARSGARFREVGFVDEEDGGVLLREPLQHPVEEGGALQDAVYAAEVQGRVSSAHAPDGIAEFDRAGGGEDVPDRGDVRLVVVVAEDGDHPVRGAEAAQGCHEIGDVSGQRTEPRVGGEVARDRDEVRRLGVDELHEP